MDNHGYVFLCANNSCTVLHSMPATSLKIEMDLAQCQQMSTHLPQTSQETIHALLIAHEFWDYSSCKAPSSSNMPSSMLCNMPCITLLATSGHCQGPSIGWLGRNTWIGWGHLLRELSKKLSLQIPTAREQVQLLWHTAACCGMLQDSLSNPSEHDISWYFMIFMQIEHDWAS